MRTVTARRAVIALGLLVLAGCGGVGSIGGGDRQEAQGSWELVEGEVDGAPLDLPGGRRITFVVEDDQVGGTVCNHYFGEWGTDGIGMLGSTDMACEPAALMELESRYLGALPRATQVARDGDELRLSGNGVDLRFAATPPVPVADLVGTTWELTTLVDGDTASSTMGEPAILVLHEDGTLEGSTGCRDLAGRWTERGDEILFTELAADGDCPDELATQDDHVVAVLGDGFRAEVDGQQLTVTSQGGQGLVYRASGAADAG